EKALRKLEATAANLTRLTDLTSELRRQLKPLGKQAEIARRAQTVQAELRDARLRLHADELVTLRGELAREEADEAAARARRAAVDSALQAAATEQASREQQLAKATSLLVSTQDTWYHLSALAERLRGTTKLAAERARHLSVPPEEHRPGRDPDELDREAEAVAARETELQAVVEQARARLSGALARRAELEQVVADAERDYLAAVRAVADRREGLARLSGKVEALRSKSGATADEIERLSAALAEARERAAAAQREFDARQHEIGVLDEGELGLNERHEEALAAHAEAVTRVEELAAEHREAEQQRAWWTARVDALSVGLARKDGTGTLLASALPGLLGSVAALVTVEAGAEAAVAAALGAATDALAVSDVEGAAAALDLLRAEDAGRAFLLVGGAPSTVDPGGWPALPAGARWAVDLVTAPASLRPALHRLLERTAVVDDLQAARALIAADPSVRAVTSGGDVLGADWAQGGSGRSQSVIEVQAEVDEAATRQIETEIRVQRLTAALDSARAEVAERAEHAENTLAALHESDAALNALAEQLGRLGEAARGATAEAHRLAGQREAAEVRRRDVLAQLEELEERWRLAENEPVDSEPDTSERDEAAAALASARGEEVEARLALRTAEERARALQGHADGLRRSAAAERAARERAVAAAAARERDARVAARVATVGELACARIEVSLARAAADRDAAAAARAEQESALSSLRTRMRELA
ncbi:MAG TPA: hypothetical protein VE270_04630, partial [Thermoleophilaceae bacterium]|nr:hypothetical protein [Thermoleophilaceae bacterium]